LFRLPVAELFWGVGRCCTNEKNRFRSQLDGRLGGACFKPPACWACFFAALRSVWDWQQLLGSSGFASKST